MQNLLIIEDNLIQAHLLANSICKEVLNIRLYGIVSTGIEALEIIKEEKVDIIILDLKLPDINGIEILDFILNNHLSKYNSSIIVFTGEMEMLSEIISNKCVFNYCSKIRGIDLVVKQIKELTKEKQDKYSIDTVNSLIKEELEILKFNFSYIGTKYLCECICECYYKNNIYNINLKKEIYPIISKKYHKTINAIKASISQATSIMYYEVSESDLSNYFGYHIINKPKPKDIIFAILEKIKCKNETLL